jgi:predicted phosphodiesterase
MAALEAVWDDVRTRKVDRVICLGDLVGYGPWPREVIRFIQEHNIPTVRGCWDEGIGLERADCGCKFVTQEDAEWGHIVFDWTKRALKPEDAKFLANLDFARGEVMARAGRVAFVHGSPRSANEYLMESTHELILFERVAGAGADVLVCGHTHVPFVRKMEGTMRVTAELGLKEQIQREMGIAPRKVPRDITLAPKILINAGSVGEPRHGTPHATYVIFDTATMATSIHAVPYNVEKTARDLLKRGLPEIFAERLRAGAELAVKNKEVECRC